MQYPNIRYSITLNDAQLDYLSDEQQDILRMKCLKTFIRMAVLEETKVSGKNYSAVLQPGQFKASKVELARLWGCDRKTATRIFFLSLFQNLRESGRGRQRPSGGRFNSRARPVIAHYNYTLRFRSCGLCRGLGQGTPAPWIPGQGASLSLHPPIRAPPRYPVAGLQQV